MKNQNITPSNITKLKKNERFVFGSNLNGAHLGGAARFAADKFGAIEGQAIGLQGKSYGFPTLGMDMQKLPLLDLSLSVRELQNTAINNPELHFLITEVGCGIAGFTAEEVAPLFKELVGLDQFSLPQAFIDVISTMLEAVVIKGFKVTDANMQCRGVQFELGKIYHVDGVIKPCRNGYHYCKELNDCFEYYDFDIENRVFEIVDHGQPEHEGDKSCTSDIEFVRELSWMEVYNLVNLGKGNTGRGNAGNDNAGNRNAGNRNAGNYNAGNDNAGNDNAGNDNAGYSNAGNDNR